MLDSFRLLLPGFFLATLIALILGVAMGLNRVVKSNIHPVLTSISVVPPLLLTPFAIHIFASFAAASRFLIFYYTIWPTLFATVNGVMTIDKRYLDNAATLQISGIKRLYHVILPAAMPSILAGFVVALRGSFIVLAFAEMFGVRRGMGYFVQYYSILGRFENVMSGFVFLVVVLVVVTQVVERIKDRILKWATH